jgi:hypothetical protein
MARMGIFAPIGQRPAMMIIIMIISNVITVGIDERF